MTEPWFEAQKWEREWWGDCSNTADEEAKQVFYADQMGILRWGTKESGANIVVGDIFDVQGRSILDIGGGPVSLLLRCRNRGRSVVLDPIRWPDWVVARYQAAGIEYRQACAEDPAPSLGLFDEVWIYNTLQHVKNPAEVIRRAKFHGKVVRIFDWIDTPANIGHPHSLSAEFLAATLGVPGTVVQSPWDAASPPTAWTGVLGTPTPRRRFHLLGLAHTQTTTEFLMCAYTQKVLKLARMLTDLGYEVVHYGAEGADVPCEHVTVVSQATQRECYGDYDWHREFFRHDPGDLAYTTFNANAIRAINERKRDGDFLLCSFGNYQKPVADAVNIPFTCEMGIGYEGVFAKYRVFESYAWMHHVYGLLRQTSGSWYDAVIPNYFDPKDFLFSGEKDPYFLYVGRLISRKGILVAAQVAEKLKVPLVVVGQGSLEEIGLHASPFLVHKGTVGIEGRASLMARARAVFVPTEYIEPFGGASIEANFSGTPVITTDWGCFAENVIHGVTGFRCRSFADFLLAARTVESLCPADIRRFAVNNFSMARVSRMYEHYFDQIDDINGQGWYTESGDRSRLNWLERWYPPSPDQVGNGGANAFADRPERTRIEV